MNAAVLRRRLLGRHPTNYVAHINTHQLIIANFDTISLTQNKTSLETIEPRIVSMSTTKRSLHHIASSHHNSHGHGRAYNRDNSSIYQNGVKSFSTHHHPTNAREFSNRAHPHGQAHAQGQSQLDQEVIQKTNEILYNTELGSMTAQQASDTKSIIVDYYTRQKQPTTERAEMAERLLERLVAEGRDGRNPVATVESRVYNAVIDAFGKCKYKEGADAGALRAEALLQRMYERCANYDGDDDGAGVKPARPDIFSYNCLIKAWCESDSVEAVEKAEEIMSFLGSGSGSESDSESDGAPHPDGVTYNIMMNTYANQIGEYGYAQKAEDILLHMTALQKDGQVSINPNTLSFNIVLKAWKNSGGGIESAQRAEDILRLMIKLYSDGHRDVRPDVISFQTVFHAYVKHADGGHLSADILDRMEGILDTLLDGTNGSDLARRPGIVSKTVNKIMECIGKSDVEDAGERGNRILQKMIAARDNGVSLDKPDDITYTRLMKSFLSNVKSVDKAYAMMDDLIDGNAPFPPSTFCINALLHHYCKKGDIDSAERLFETMSSIADRHGYKTLPDVATYNMMADLYFRNHGNEHSAQKAFSILEQVEDAFDAGVLPQLDPFLYQIVIRKVSKSTTSKTRRKSYDALMKMIQRFDQGALNTQPNTFFYNLVLSALAKERTHHSTVKVMEILNLMEDRALKGNNVAFPNMLSYKHSIRALVNTMNRDTPKKLVEIVDKVEYNEENERGPGSLLDSAVFESVLLGLSHTKFGDSDFANDMVKRIRRMEENGHNNVKLNSTCLNLAIKALCNKNVSDGSMVAFDAHRYVMNLVTKYDNGEVTVLPSKVGFNTLLSCWVKTKHWKNVLKTEEVYKTMERLSREGVDDISPDEFTNSLMLRNYSGNTNKKVQRKALTFMDNVDFDQLDTFAFNCMLTLLARSTIQNKVEKAQKLLLHMEQRKLASVASYNNMLHVCASTKGDHKEKALTVAHLTYKELLTSVLPNEASFALAMKAYNNLSQNQADKEIGLKLLFDDVCDRGFLGENVLKELKFGLPSEEKQKSLLGYALSSQLEKKWSRCL